MRIIILLFCACFSVLTYAASEPPRYDIDFSGGTAIDFAEVISELGINAIFPDNAELITIPAIKLRNVTQRDLFNALNIVGRDAPISFAWDRSGNDLPMVIQADGSVSNDQSSQIWVLSSVGSQKTAQPFSIGPLLENDSNENGFTVDEITSAIASAAEAAAAAEGRFSELEFKFHEGTDLLIIVGRTENVRVAATVLRSLSQSRMKTPYLYLYDTPLLEQQQFGQFPDNSQGFVVDGFGGLRGLGGQGGRLGTRIRPD